MKKIIFMVLAAAMFVGCYKVDIYWSDHPKQGRLVLVTDWSKRTTGVELPPNYTVRLLEPPAIVTFTKTRVEFPNLFDPGTYTLYLHNNAANIVMNGTVASVLVESGEIGPQAMNLDNPQQEVQTLPLSTRAPGEEYYSNAMPGFLFWGSVTQTIEADHDYEVIVPMRQITRQLEFDFTITEGDPSLIREDVSAVLRGVAQAWDCEADKPVGPAMENEFMMTRDGNKVTGMTRLLGVTDEELRLLIMVNFTNVRWPYMVVCNVTDQLKGFNAKDRTSPLLVKGNLHIREAAGGEIEVSISDLKAETSVAREVL